MSESSETTGTGEYTYDTVLRKHQPRHRVDPMRPANPHTADPELQSYYEERIAEGRTGPNWTVRLICFVILGFSGWVLWMLITANVGAGR